LNFLERISVDVVSSEIQRFAQNREMLIGELLGLMQD